MSPAQTDHPVHDLIASRWSPYAFDERDVSAEDLRSLFEAARWAPSSYNEQPWSFFVARKSDATKFQALLSCLVEANQQWAGVAPVLALTVARDCFARNDKPNRHAFHDVGLAVANLTFEATVRGLSVHQMAGIDPERARDVFHIPYDRDAVTGLAIGYAADPASVPAALKDRDANRRPRKTLAEFVFSDQWGQSADL